MKKIGIGIFTAPKAGGAYQYTRAILQAFSILQKDDKAKAICYSEYELWRPICEEMGLSFCKLSAGPLRKILYHVGYELTRINITNSFFYGFHPLWECYKRDNLDLMFITSPSYYGKIKGAKLVMPIFDIMHRYINFEEIGGGDISKERDRRYGAICKNADGILADSKLGVDQIVECYGTNDNSLVNRVYSLPFIVPDYINDNNMGDKVDIPKKYIIYPAQFWKHKNHVSLVKALGELKKQGVFVHLVFTGSGKNAWEDIELAIKENEVNDQITNLGYVTDDELVYLYRHARAMIFPSMGGPTNIPPIEAQAIGCPVAVSDNFDMPRQVGRAGLTFDPTSVSEIQKVMERLWTDDALCEELSKKGIEKSKEWTISQFSDSLNDIIEKIISL